MNTNDLFNSFWVRFISEAAKYTYNGPLDKQEFIDSLTESQLHSKSRLYELVAMDVNLSVHSVEVAGGWYGLTAILAALALEKRHNKGKVKMFSVDHSPKATQTAQGIFRSFEPEFQCADLSAICASASSFRITDYLGRIPSGKVHLAVNPSCEHMTRGEIELWYKGLPIDTRLILSSTNMQAEDHLNTRRSAFEFAQECEDYGMAVTSYTTLYLPVAERYFVRALKT